MTAPADAFEAAVRLADALEAAGIAYALGGALAYGQYGIPRATNDVDVNVFVRDDGLPAVAGALRSVGIDVTDDALRHDAAAEGLSVLRLGDVRVDVFTPSIAFSWEAERTRRRASVDDRDVWFLAPEALAVFKLLFFRTKDLADLERLVAVSGRAMDLGYVRERVREMMGDDDPRVAAWDRICADHLPAS
jgi:hypothetical protein